MSLNALKHGMSSDPVYRAWKQMRQRCNNPKAAGFHNYGGRGIRVCARWDDFPTFLADIGPRPPGLSLERRNNDGDYEPGNCVWATKVDQGCNRRTTRLIMIDGVTRTAKAWCKITGVAYSTAMSRMNKLNWSAIDAVAGRNQPMEI